MARGSQLLRTLFTGFCGFIVLVLAGGTFLAIKSIGQIDQVEAASEDLDSRNLRFTPKFRAQIYRLQSLAFRSRITGDPSYAERYQNQEQELRRFLDERRGIFDSKEETALFLNLEEKLAPYLAELKPGEQSTLGEDEGELLAALQDRVSGMSESLQRLGDGLPSHELRWQLQRSFSSLLLVLARGTPQQEGNFVETLDELRETLAEVTQELGNSNERQATALANFSKKLTKFQTEGQAATTRWVKKGNTTKRFQHLEKMEAARDELFELAQELGDFRRSAFNTSLSSYRSLIQGMQYSIFIALGMLFVSLFAMGWLARRAFIKPIKLSLAEAEKTASTHESLASIGTLASGVAHEIRNPITTIKARLFALNELSRENESMNRQVSAIQEETDRMEHIVSDFLSFARPSEAKLEKVSTAEFLDEIHALVLPEMQARGLALEMDRTVEANARIDPEQLRQVFLNLIRNAAEACPESTGKITLSSTLKEGKLLLIITDNGSGIPAEIQPRVFEPFFSKKKGGTGLGLAICRNIVEAHGGSLTFTSVEGQGTTFTITL